MLWQQRNGGNVCFVLFALESSIKKKKEKKAAVMKDSNKQSHTPRTLKHGFSRAAQKQFAVITIV